MKKTILILSAAILFSCRTIDLEKKTKLDTVAKAGKIEVGKKEALPVEVTPDIVIVEKPVYVPEGKSAEAERVTGNRAVSEANKGGIVKPEDYSKAANTR